MTVAELIIGMLMTSMVLAALGAVWYAVGQTWAAQGSVQSAGLTGAQAVLRIENRLREARYVFQAPGSMSTSNLANGSGGVFFWKADDWNGSADGAVQIGELALVEQEGDRIVQYAAIAVSRMNTSQRTRASGVATWAELSNPTTPLVFKGYDFVERTVLATSVRTAMFDVPTASTASARPLVEFAVTVTRPGSSDVSTYGSVTLRAPTTRPK